MKKRLILCLFIWLCTLSACTDDEGLKMPSAAEQQPTLMTRVVELAQQAYVDCYPTSSRDGNVAFYEYDVLPITMVNSRAAVPDTLFYVVNEANGNGFVALTAGVRPEILAVSDNGSVEDVNNIDIPGLKMFFDAASNYSISKSSSIGDGRLDPLPYIKESILYEIVNITPPRCKTKWGQRFPEGIYCPNGLSGCTITATAQALSYFEVPSEINLTYPNSDLTNLLWN